MTIKSRESPGDRDAAFSAFTRARLFNDGVKAIELSCLRRESLNYARLHRGWI